MTAPTDQPHTLYRFFGAGGELLYVGLTSDPGARWREHRSGRSWWQQVTQATLEHYPDRASCEAAERVAIAAENPLFNKRERILRRQGISRRTSSETATRHTSECPRQRRRPLARSHEYVVILPYTLRVVGHKGRVGREGELIVRVPSEVLPPPVPRNGGGVGWPHFSMMSRSQAEAELGVLLVEQDGPDDPEHRLRVVPVSYSNVA